MRDTRRIRHFAQDTASSLRHAQRPRPRRAHPHGAPAGRRVAGDLAAPRRRLVRHRARGSSSAGPICLKRALPRLKVQADWQAPVERNRYEVDWMRTAGAIVPGAVPRILGDDRESGMFAMEFLEAESHPLWKAQLRDGEISLDTAARGRPQRGGHPRGTPPPTPRSRGILRPTTFSFRSASSPTCPLRRSNIPTAPRDSKA